MYGLGELGAPVCVHRTGRPEAAVGVGPFLISTEQRSYQLIALQTAMCRDIRDDRRQRAHA
jgi:hypothetical protein